VGESGDRALNFMEAMSFASNFTECYFEVTERSFLCYFMEQPKFDGIFI
jgi:hypothetical protein